MLIYFIIIFNIIVFSLNFKFILKMFLNFIIYILLNITFVSIYCYLFINIEEKHFYEEALIKENKVIINKNDNLFIVNSFNDWKVILNQYKSYEVFYNHFVVIPFDVLNPSLTLNRGYTSLSFVMHYGLLKKKNTFFLVFFLSFPWKFLKKIFFKIQISATSKDIEDFISNNIILISTSQEIEKIILKNLIYVKTIKSIVIKTDISLSNINLKEVYNMILEYNLHKGIKNDELKKKIEMVVFYLLSLTRVKPLFKKGFYDRNVNRVFFKTIIYFLNS
jgi:hypothetical protein